MDRLLIVDGNSLLYRGYFATTESISRTTGGEYINAVVAFDNMLKKAIKIFNPTHLLVVFDKGKDSFRFKLFPDYKANRPDPPLDLVPQFKLVRDYLDASNIKWTESEKYEADDLIGSLTKRWFVEYAILTSDRDLLQLTDFLTTVYLMKHGLTEYKECNEEYFLKEYDGLKPKQLIDYKALVGDKSDNVPGVAGIGDKTAKNLLVQYGSCDEIYKNLDSLSKGAKSKLEKGKEDCYFSKQLVTIKTDINVKPDLESLRLNIDKVKRSIFYEKHEMPEI